MTQEVENWTFNVLPGQADRRSEKQSPWYDMATAAVAMIARPYIPQGGKVYDLGCAAGNVGRVLAPTLHEREAQFVALDGCRDVVVDYCGPGRAIMADVASPIRLWNKVCQRPEALIGVAAKEICLLRLGGSG